jgi:hypothetical protein
MKKLVNYLDFIATGIAKEASPRRALGFIAGEIKEKTFCFQNKSKIAEMRQMRRSFDATPPSDYVYNASPVELEKLHVFSMCHGDAIPEQKLSILSFLRHVGAPAKWNIVSDGSVSESQAEVVRSIHPSIDVLDWRAFLCEENKVCFDRFSKCPGILGFAKKFVLVSNMPDLEVLYLDNDILFFEGAENFRELLNNLEGNSYYQRDLPGYLYSLFLTKAELEAPPLNSGLMVQGRRLDWSEPIARLNLMFSRLTPSQVVDTGIEQSACHLAHYLAGSRPLGEKYALQLSDRFDLKDRFSGPKYATRHYVRPVRLKMWLHAKDYLRQHSE